MLKLSGFMATNFQPLTYGTGPDMFLDHSVEHGRVNGERAIGILKVRSVLTRIRPAFNMKNVNAAVELCDTYSGDIVHHC
jgi:hypothetical protein